MNYRMTSVFISLLLLLFMGLVAPAQGEEFFDCPKSVALEDFKSKQLWQMDLRNLIVRGKPEFKELANLQFELQVTLAFARKEVIGYLLERQPDRIATDQGLSKFSNFDWSEQDGDKFAAESEKSRKLMESIEKLKQANDSHPGWGEMRAYMNKTLGKSDEFKALLTRFMADQKQVAALLDQCPTD